METVENLEHFRNFRHCGKFGEIPHRQTKIRHIFIPAKAEAPPAWYEMALPEFHLPRTARPARSFATHSVRKPAPEPPHRSGGHWRRQRESAADFGCIIDILRVPWYNTEKEP
ncbi:hypothetical protein [uncultured Ruminococcus sp.]|uniref:hypothetical protein n=1 Tax=uncultured Ruminococcus sp. TaxID=165186 RepID=UPI00266CBF98|nr:hypothetical protein [uncultured Ruminococcus sp.]